MIQKLLRKYFKNTKAPINSHDNKYGKFYNSDVFTNTKIEYTKYDVGDYTYGTPHIIDMAPYNDIATKPTNLKIGKFCSLGSNLLIVLGSEHRSDWITTYPFNALNDKFRHIKGHPDTKGDVIIGNDVWIGVNVTILSGVNIGNGAVIGANSLIIKDVPAYSIVAGSPAILKKNRFTPQIVDNLQKIAWWDLPIETIEKYIYLLQSNRIEEFIAVLNKTSLKDDLLESSQKQ